MRKVLWIAVLLAGCEREQAAFDIVGELAANGAAAIVAASKPEPPKPSDVCENCNGTGKVGDTVTVKVCPVCKGSGKK